jgi:hypothetical protein
MAFLKDRRVVVAFAVFALLALSAVPRPGALNHLPAFVCRLLTPVVVRLDNVCAQQFYFTRTIFMLVYFIVQGYTGMRNLR